MARGFEKIMMRASIVFDPEMGRRLNYARQKMKNAEGKPILQAELARLLGVSQATISKIETGKQTGTIINVGRIRAVLGKHFNFVLTGEGAENYKPYQPLTKARQHYVTD
jgi:transcriptional regulator with XRE-family HTH domain